MAARPFLAQGLSLALIWFFGSVVLFSPSESMPGNYVTYPKFKDKRLLPINALHNLTAITTDQQCQSICELDDDCGAFCVSTLERNCQLHKLKLGSKGVKSSSYILYVKQMPQDEGYYVFEAEYIKPILRGMTYRGAKRYCEDSHGMVVAVKSEEMNKMLVKLMTYHALFAGAYIGLSDEQQEGIWTHLDEAGITYKNWAYDGQWSRRDKNCVALSITGLWNHVSCLLHLHFFCQIPMY